MQKLGSKLTVRDKWLGNRQTKQTTQKGQWEGYFIVSSNLNIKFFFWSQLKYKIENFLKLLIVN